MIFFIEVIQCERVNYMYSAWAEVINSEKVVRMKINMEYKHNNRLHTDINSDIPEIFMLSSHG